MSVEFSNAYQEILIDNLMAVIKQNFVFQTQLKLAEKVGKEKEELSKKVQELSAEGERLKNDLKELEVYKNKAEQNTTSTEEKNRIQTALNEEMKKSSALKNDLQNVTREVESLKKQIINTQNSKTKELSDLENKKNKEIEELKLQIEKLEEIASPAKLKKLNSEKEVVEQKDETPKIKNNLQKILDGSSF
jgi:chromosome segregation ATPase